MVGVKMKVQVMGVPDLRTCVADVNRRIVV